MAMEHYELVQEMPSIERMTTQDRLKHARKRRSQQLKKWAQYEKQLDRDSAKKKKKSEPPPQQVSKKNRRRQSDRVKFVPNIALLESAARNDLEEVRKLLENKVSPDVTNEDGLTALHQCCIDDNEEMLKLLLEFGANVNACDSEMWTPLHAAATCGHVTLCQHLIDRGAELLAVNADGNMPYDICEDDITLDYIETEMAKRGITQEQIDETRLTTERKMLHDLKAHADKGGDLETKDAMGATFLHIAAANGYVEVADFLLDHHVNVDARDNESWQPIHAASYWGQLDILEQLVQNGADLDAKTKNGETPFDLSEDPDIKQRILDMKDEIETNRASRQRPGSTRKLKHSSRNLTVHQDSVYSSNTSLNSKPSSSASMRRSSLRGEKSSLFKKEAHEEALHFGLRMMQDDDELTPLHEEKENLPATNIDDVTITFEDHEPAPGNRSDQNSAKESSATNATNQLPGGNTNRKPPVMPRSGGKPPAPGSQAGPTQNDLKNQRNDVQDPPSKDNNKNVLDKHFQNMFLETVPRVAGNTGNRTSTASVTSTSSAANSNLHFYPPPMMEKTRNGHNNNNNNNTTVPASRPAQTNTSANQPHSSFREGQLRRFVAPPTSPVVGGDEDEKKVCCTIL